MEPPLVVSLTSPPYEKSVDRWGKEPNELLKTKHIGARYGDIPALEGQTYLSAMAQVYAEISCVADVLVVVVKNPTRNGKLRRLDLDTIALLEAAGWRIHCLHHAMLFEETEQGHLFDDSQKRVKGRMSFFKRLAWQKGSPVADHEDVIVVVKGERHE